MGGRAAEKSSFIHKTKKTFIKFNFQEREMPAFSLQQMQM